MALVHHSDLDRTKLADGTVYLAVMVVDRPGDLPSSVKLVPLDVTRAEADEIIDAVDKYRQHAPEGSALTVPLPGRGHHVPAPRRAPESRPAARPAVQVRQVPAKPAAAEDTAERKAEAQRARQWAIDNNLDIEARGRVPVDIMEKYRASLAKPAKPLKAVAPAAERPVDRPAVPSATFVRPAD